jgi:surface antigen
MRNKRAFTRRVRLTRRLGVLALLGVLGALLPLLGPSPAFAQAPVDDYPVGLKNAPQDSLVDPWKFYNRECTSFVAWRLNHLGGVAFNDYFLGAHWGNASHWKAAANSVGITVDNSPVPGAVAWWAAGSAGSSRGHVAWVQSVGGSSITIEEYNYVHEGGYSIRVISSSSSLWPSGFIHVQDTALRNTAPPTLTGTPQVGVKLKTSKGSWNPTSATFAYQWLANGSPIAGATKRAFTPTAAQLGARIKAVVTASKSGMQATTVKTSKTAPVAPGVFNASSAPTVSGTPRIGLSLSATTGTWTPAGTYAYKWFADHKPIKGATASTFSPAAAQLGKVISVRVTASAAGYTTQQATSADTAAVVPGLFAASGPPTISGIPQVDHPLTATSPTWTPAGTVSYQWLANGNPIAGATSTSYTPTPDVVHQQLAVVVTVTQTAYQDASATSAATDPVALGTFLNTVPPTVGGTPQVGVALTANPGTWSPDASFSYQWFVADTVVVGATGATYTPTPADLGKTVAVSITATRPGYLTALDTSADSAAVIPGDIASTEPPTTNGRAVVGHTLNATSGQWSITPEHLTYQWYDDDQPIAGATGASYVLVDTDAGHRVTVQVTASATAYNPKTVASKATPHVVFGRAKAAARPVLGGKAVVGHTLKARVGAVTPTTAVASYRWFRAGKRIHGAHDVTYLLRPGDVGSRIHVEVTLKAPNWTTTRKTSKPALVTKAVPSLVPHWSLRAGRVLLRLVVHAPGLTNPRGAAEVLDGKQTVGTIKVVAGRGRVLLARLPSGHHRLRIQYAGRGPQVAAHLRLTVSVP